MELRIQQTFVAHRFFIFIFFCSLYCCYLKVISPNYTKKSLIKMKQNQNQLMYSGLLLEFLMAELHIQAVFWSLKVSQYGVKITKLRK